MNKRYIHFLYVAIAEDKHDCDSYQHKNWWKTIAVDTSCKHSAKYLIIYAVQKNKEMFKSTYKYWYNSLKQDDDAFSIKYCEEDELGNMTVPFRDFFGDDDNTEDIVNVESIEVFEKTGIAECDIISCNSIFAYENVNLNEDILITFIDANITNNDNDILLMKFPTYMCAYSNHCCEFSSLEYIIKIQSFEEFILKRKNLSDENYDVTYERYNIVYEIYIIDSINHRWTRVEYILLPHNYHPKTSFTDDIFNGGMKSEEYVIQKTESGFVTAQIYTNIKK